MIRRVWKKTDTSGISFTDSALLYNFGLHVGILHGDFWKCYAVKERKVLENGEIEEVCEEVEFVPMRALFTEEVPVKLGEKGVYILPGWTITPFFSPRPQSQARPQAQARPMRPRPVRW